MDSIVRKRVSLTWFQMLHLLFVISLTVCTYGSATTVTAAESASAQVVASGLPRRVWVDFLGSRQANGDSPANLILDSSVRPWLAFIIFCIVSDLSFPRQKPLTLAP